jgi:hypothetical protein
MEIIRGKKTSFIDAREVTEKIAGYEQVHIDIGTGDGRFVTHTAKKNRNHFLIGLDACRENLVDASRRAPSNSLFVIANALNLPSELHGIANRISINFPWGSLMEGLVYHDEALLQGISAIAKPDAELAIYLNAGAVKEAGFSLEEGATRALNALANHDFMMRSAIGLVTEDMKYYPTTWAKRLAFGRDPHAIYLYGLRR